MPFLIDITDARFMTPENAGVIAFIRSKNPFAHSDVGSLLFELGRELPGALAYCPSPANYAYVVLHTAADRIFAIAYGMTGIAFLVPADAIADALADGGSRKPEIGDGWISVDPWPPETPSAEYTARVRRWCRTAYEGATAK